jgi:hypothetical protein
VREYRAKRDESGRWGKEDLTKPLRMEMDGDRAATWSVAQAGSIRLHRAAQLRAARARALSRTVAPVATTLIAWYVTDNM